MENIFRTNIQQLQQIEHQHHEISGTPKLFIMEQDIMRFAAEHYNKYPKGKGGWNGRQIRNAFVVAASLARYEAEQPGLVGTGFQPQLRYSHFQEVEKLTEEYNQFRAHVLGFDDSQKAFLNLERDDNFGDYEDKEKQSDIVNRIEMARNYYANQQKGQAQGQASNSGVGHTTYSQTPFTGPPQPMPMYYDRLPMGQSRNQIASPYNYGGPSTPQTQSQGRYMSASGTFQSSRLPRPVVEDQSAAAPGRAQSQVQAPAHSIPDTQE